MVGSVSNFSRSGLADWLLQRISAVVLFVFTACILGFFLMHPSVTYANWKSFMQTGFMRFWGLLTLISILVHAWIGLWTVFTDYVKNTVVRLSCEVLLALLLFFYLYWGFQIVFA